MTAHTIDRAIVLLHERAGLPPAMLDRCRPTITYFAEHGYDAERIVSEIYACPKPFVRPVCAGEPGDQS